MLCMYVWSFINSFNMSTKSYRGILYVFAMLCGIGANAQDTLRLTLQQAEQQFIENNLILLAEKYNIDAAKAQVLQAKLYNNPSIAVSGNAYNPENRKYPDISNRTGQYTIDVQQLIVLAGKRNKQVQLAHTNSKLAEERFMDVLRTLRYTLRSNFYRTLYLQNSYQAYTVQIASLERLNATYQELHTRGAVTLKDAVRIKSLLYALKAEQTSLQNEINDVGAELQLLLQMNDRYISPVADENHSLFPMVSKQELQKLLDSAYTNRYDLKAAQTNIVFAEQNYALQKALAVPDLTLGGTFDKRGAHVENATFLNLAIDLPFFNRNQGNIRAARIDIAQSKVLLQHQRMVVENEVQKAYNKALHAERVLQTIDPGFRNDFEKLLQSVTENFQKRNISLLEFTDFYESYKDSLLQLNQLQNEMMQAIEELHLAIGKTIINN